MATEQDVRRGKLRGREGKGVRTGGMRGEKKGRGPKERSAPGPALLRVALVAILKLQDIWVTQLRKAEIRAVSVKRLSVKADEGLRR